MFFEHRGLLEGRDARPVHDAGASSFLYPFLGRARDDLDAVLADVRASIAGQGRRDRAAARADAGREPRGAGRRGRGAARARSSRRRGARAGQRRLGDRRDGRRRRLPRRRRAAWPGRARALDLTDDPAILTAIANDIGVEAIFSRQVIAYGRRAATRCWRCRPAALGQRDRRPGGGAPPRAADGRLGRLRRRPDRRRGAGRPRRGHALGAHPAHPGGAGERVPRAARLVEAPGLAP